MGESDLFKKVLVKNDQHVLYSNVSETVIYQEYFQHKPLNEQQIKQIHDLLSGKQYAAYLLKVNGGGLIPYEDETFDFAIMVTVDCFVADVRKVYLEIFRILRKAEN